MRSQRKKICCFYRFTAVLILLLLLNSCNIYRYVPKDDYLFTGSNITFVKKSKENSDVKSELMSKTFPLPNQRILLLRLPLMSYSISSHSEKKFINYYLHEKFGEPPVLLSQTNPSDMRRRMEAQLNDLGYLNGTLHDSIIRDGRKAHINFQIELKERYLMDTITFPTDSSDLSKAIAASGRRTILKKGVPFTLDAVKTERERINLYLRNRGFFFFSADFLILEADTNHKNRVCGRMTVKPDIPKQAAAMYTIRNFTIYSNYSADRDSVLHHLPFRQEEGFKHIDTLPRFKPVLFRENIVMKEGDIFKFKNQQITTGRMVNLNNFKFINMMFTPVDSAEKPMLDATLYLTPYNRRSIQAELGCYSKSNNYVGTEIKLKLTNRNLFHTGDHIDFDISAGFEEQLTSRNMVTYNNRNYSGSVNFYTPHFYLPFRFRRLDSEFIPRNRISLSAEYLHKPRLYTMRSIRLSYGYLWKSGKSWEHSFDPLVLNLVNPTNITATYDSTLASDPYLAKSFEKVFIMGGEYTLTYNSHFRKSFPLRIYNSTMLSVAGNLPGLVIKPAKADTSLHGLLDVPYAQYVMLNNDFRIYYSLTNSVTWVNRIYMGYGYAYHNSETMPFIKQFFIGGSNSLRAFRNGTLGPGTYTDSIIRSQAIQAGEIKLEFNSELRLKLIKYIYTAVFADAGNIWYRTEQASMPGARFSRNWYKELAVDAGVGLRVDFSLMVIRLDLAMPLRLPSNPEGQRWVVDDIDVGSPGWRKENILLNIAFGYPF
jgi:hypothetical protein